MIADTIENLGTCPVTKAQQEQILAYITQCRKNMPAAGRYVLDGEELFALAQSYQSKPRAGLFMESHEKYADLQVMISGSERMLWACADELELTRDLRPETDIMFYKEAPERGSFVLDAGMFAYFAPGDAHIPCVHRTDGSPEAVEKVVFKIRQKV